MRMRATALRGRRVALGVAIVIAAFPAGAAADATLTVTTTDEFSVTDCSLNEAITSANINNDFGACDATGTYGNDTINITATGTINLTGPMTPITSNIDVNGPGAGQLEIHRQSGGDYRVVSVSNAATAASLSGVTITNGRLTIVGLAGAGVGNFGTLELEDVVVRDNQVINSESGLNPAPSGGGIINGGTLTLRRGTVASNSVSSVQTAASGAVGADASGGGILNTGTLTVERSTVSGNNVSAQVMSSDAGASAFAAGAGIANLGTSATVRLSTLSDNHTTATAPGAATETTRGGGIYNLGTIALVSDTLGSNTAQSSASLSAQGTESVTNTILDGGGQPNCDGSVNTDGGTNLAWYDACTGLPGAIQVDPQLQPLADNGGPTRTRALGLTSPAIDAGSSAGDSSDQRGLGRIFDFPAIANAVDGADIGALEARDTDGDGINDDADPCETLDGGGSSSGCPLAQGTLTVKYSKRHKRFAGTLDTPGFACAGGRGVDVYRKLAGDPDKLVGQTLTEPDGAYALKKKARRGKRYYSQVTRALRPDVADCAEATSPTIKIPR